MEEHGAAALAAHPSPSAAAPPHPTFALKRTPGASAPLGPDTLRFLDTLAALATGAPLLEDDSDSEDFAARQLFDFSLTAAAAQVQQPLHVARAPGRLDVMGGIADYSGSLVLQV